jgi:hypothetical protein
MHRPIAHLQKNRCDRGDRSIRHAVARREFDAVLLF